MKRLLRSPQALFSVLVVALATWAQGSGLAFGGDERPPLPPTDLRQTSPGSWTYTFWSSNHHGK